MEPKYPEIEVELFGSDGNAFAIMGKVRRALKRARVGQDEVDAFTSEATSGDYDHLIATCCRWVSVS